MNVFGTLIANRPMGIGDSSRINKIMSSYDNVIQLDNSDDEYFTQLADIYLKNLNSQILNKGVIAFQQGVFDKANDWFIECQILVSADTLGYLYAGINALNMKRMDLVMTNYSKMVDLGSNSSSIYKILIGLETTETQDFAEPWKLHSWPKPNS